MTAVVAQSQPRAWTPEQATAIERREGELLLDAGAGSGKTSVLVERFVGHVLEDGIAVGSILAITFTDKAAAELRDRIRSRLVELGASAHARATEAAFISTIHGFCVRVLRAGALSAGLDPGFVVLDRDQSDALAAAAFDAVLSRSAPETAVPLVAAFGAGPLRQAILSTHARLRSSGQLSPRLPPVTAQPLQAPRRRLFEAIAALSLELGAVSSPGASVVEALARLERCRELIADVDVWPAEFDRLRLRGNGNALGTDACGEYRAALEAYQAACAAHQAEPVLRGLDSLLRGFDEQYAELKRSASGLDFEDLELLTLDLLRKRPELRRGYTQRFARIMVDEQQDTNRVQLELIEAIADDNLFTVGDAQQSIYRFRHADVALFERRGEQLAAVGRRLTLQTNFRSRPEILEVINSAFGSAMGEHFAPLRPGRAIGAQNISSGMSGAPRVELLLVDKGAEWELEGMAAPWRLAEARALAARVAELVAQGTPPGDVVILTRATTDMRAYERALEAHGLPTYVIGGRGYWSHPQVLDMVAYLSVLANPRDEEALYTVLVSPLVGASFDSLVVLAGGARTAGVDPWTLLCDPGLSLDDLEPAEDQALRRFASWTSLERVRAGRGGLASLIDRALEETGYDRAMLALPGGRRRLANVRKLLRVAGEFENDHGPDLAAFVRTLADRASGRAGDPRESEAPVEGDGLDAVRLMTIHRAKGLEWPVVCVADLGRSPRPPHQILRVSPDGRVGLRLSRPGVRGRVSALDYGALGDEERRADEEEEKRLFYVAMTRARERLVLSGATRFDGWTGAANSTGGGPVAWIAPALISDFGRCLSEDGGVVACGQSSVRVQVSHPEAGSAGTEPRVLASPGPSGSPGPFASPGPSASPASPSPLPVPADSRRPPAVASLSYSALGAWARCGYRFYAERVLKLPEVREPAGSEMAPDRSATERGVLLHALLEQVSFRRPLVPDADAVRRTAKSCGQRQPSQAEAAELAELVAGFIASPLRTRLTAVREPRREERFAFALRDGVLVTGAIDVLAREAGGNTLIVDYKSDRLGEGDPEALVRGAYRLQRLVYALAALHAGADRVEVVHFFLERPEEPAVAVFPASQRSSLQAELEAAATGILEGEFRVADVPHRGLCAGCPAEGGLCSWPLAMTRREAVDRLF